MYRVKMLPMALTVLSFGAVTAFAEIKLTDNLSTSGFLDMSASGLAPDVGDANLNATFDQLELDFMLKFGNISGRADINSLGGGGVTFEQGYVTGTSGALSVTAGRFASCSGFEGLEPTAMYQYSYGKTYSTYGVYENGVGLNYAVEKWGIYGAVVSDIWAAGESDFLTPGIELQFSLMPAEGVTAKVAYLYQMYDEDITGDASQQLVNVWASYAKGPVTVGVEYNQLLDWIGGTDNAETGMGYLAMANYKINDKVAATVRYSGLTIGDGDPDSEITFSPSYAISGNWLVLAEVKQEIDAKNTDYAVESTFSF